MRGYYIAGRQQIKISICSLKKKMKKVCAEKYKLHGMKSSCRVTFAVSGGWFWLYTYWSQAPTPGTVPESLTKGATDMQLRVD
jgi:hypothetical protein